MTKDKTLKTLLLGILLIAIITPLLLNFFVYFADVFKPYLTFSVSANLNISYNEYLTIYFCIINIILTSVFSYLVWKTSDKLTQLEAKRDDCYIIENATIIYYDLVLGFSNLAKLKITGLNDPQNLYFSSEWTKNISSLALMLGVEQTKLLYILYGELHSLKDSLCKLRSLEGEEKNEFEEILNSELNRIGDTVFLDFENLADYKIIETDIKEQYRTIICNLKYKINVTDENREGESRF